MSEIIKRLAEIQSELKAPKNQYNSFGEYKYRNCEDILEALKPILKAKGMAVTITDTVKQIGERYYIEATATLHGGEDRISSTALAREAETKKGMDASQITGSASSYARKYALNGLFAIDDTKDSDSTSQGETAADSSNKVICAKCGKEIKGQTDKTGKYFSAKQIADGRGGLCISCYARSRVAAE